MLEGKVRCGLSLRVDDPQLDRNEPGLPLLTRSHECYARDN
jgi:hypothetical protein